MVAYIYSESDISELQKRIKKIKTYSRTEYKAGVNYVYAQLLDSFDFFNVCSKYSQENNANLDIVYIMADTIGFYTCKNGNYKAKDNQKIFAIKEEEQLTVRITQGARYEHIFTGKDAMKKYLQYEESRSIARVNLHE